MGLNFTSIINWKQGRVSYQVTEEDHTYKARLLKSTFVTQAPVELIIPENLLDKVKGGDSVTGRLISMIRFWRDVHENEQVAGLS